MSAYVYVREIVAPWIIEVVAERFDDAINIMPADCLIYGGAIRDAIAGLPLKGDLDIAVPLKRMNGSHGTMSVFLNSIKWIQAPEKKAVSTNGDLFSIDDNPYNKNNLSLRKGVRSFINNEGAVVQLITPSVTEYEKTTIPFEKLFDFVRTVDLRCCGLAMTRNGIVYELLEGAESDCKNKELYINQHILKKIQFNRTRTRIYKLKDRGWENKISLRQLKKDTAPFMLANKKAKVEVEVTHKQKVAGRHVAAAVFYMPENHSVTEFKGRLSNYGFSVSFADVATFLQQVKSKIGEVNHYDCYYQVLTWNNPYYIRLVCKDHASKRMLCNMLVRLHKENTFKKIGDSWVPVEKKSGKISDVEASTEVLYTENFTVPTIPISKEAITKPKEAITKLAKMGYGAMSTTGFDTAKAKAKAILFDETEVKILDSGQCVLVKAHKKVKEIL